MKILVTGANGQVGRALQRKFAGSDHDIDFTDREQLDMRNDEAVFQYALSQKPEVIINCAAYTAVDRAETEPQACVEINQDAVRVLAKAAEQLDARFIHISTDYVYHNGINRPLRETDPTEPKSVYARTKLSGEQEARAAYAKTITLRTSWVYGLEGHNFLRTMQRLGAEREKLNVVSDQIGAPTFADDLAEAIITVVETPDFAPGTYNYSGLGVASWYDFAQAIMEVYSLSARVEPIMTSDYPTPAARPNYSILDLTKARKAGLPLKYWREALSRFVALETAQRH